jgi:hypothetical protein
MLPSRRLRQTAELTYRSEIIAHWAIGETLETPCVSQLTASAYDTCSKTYYSKYLHMTDA